jgi:hypothetical protein
MTEANEVERDLAGETVLGFRVAAYRETHPEHGSKYGHHYSEHWSTPNTRNPAVKVERLFTEDQLREALSRPAGDGWKPDREAVARLIEPNSWKDKGKGLDDTLAHINRRTSSLRKADAILTLLPAAPSSNNGESE